MNAVAAAEPVYLLDHNWEQEPYRLALLEHHADPTSVRRLQATGVGAGWLEFHLEQFGFWRLSRMESLAPSNAPFFQSNA